jgi:methylated-DNA-[protein]-cysteine S-methyltransferase
LDIAVGFHDAPQGPLLLAATEIGIVRVALPGADHDEVLEHLAAAVSPRVLHAPHPAVEQARRELDAYFAGRLRAFTVPLDRRLSSGFRRAALDAIAAIPYGATATYAEVAARAGNPRAVRAAGSACATNPIPLIVPCHRVLRSDGTVGGYGGGAEMKRALLDLEGAEGATARGQLRHRAGGRPSP